MSARKPEDDVLHRRRFENYLDLTSMFEAFKDSLAEIPDKSGIDLGLTKLDGFDGNDDEENKYYDLFRAHSEPGEQGIYNSNGKRLIRYLKLLERWKALGKKPLLTKEEIQKITRTPLWE